MYNTKLFRSKNRTFRSLINSHRSADKYSIFKYLFNRNCLIDLDIEVYQDGTLIFAGCVGEFINIFYSELKEATEQEEQP